MSTIAENIAAYAVSLKYDDIPEETIHKAKGLLIDTLGCAIGGYSSEPAKIARRMAGNIYQLDLPGTIIGSGQKTSLDLATFANGIMIRYLDFNDGFQSIGGGHPSDNFAPVLTCADAVEADGKDIILGAVLAYEVFCRMADHFEAAGKGFDHCVNGAVSCTVGAARILGLNEEQMVQAINLGLAPNIALGQTRVGEVSMWKGCAMANTSRNAVFAAQLAAGGMTGPAPIFEGRQGFFNAISGPFEMKEFGGKERPFRIMEATIKRYPCGQLAQTAIDAAVKLSQQIPDVSDIKEVNVSTFQRAKNVMAGDPEKWHPNTRESADHSLPYVVAIGLIYGTLEARHFDDKYIQDPKVRELLGKIKVAVTEDCEKLHPDACANKVEVVTKSGKKLSEFVRYHRGHHRNPLSDGEIEQKFESLSRDLLLPEQRQEIFQHVWDIEELDDASHLMDLTRI